MHTTEVKCRQSGPPTPEKRVQMSLGSYDRSAKQHLFLLVLPLATGSINGQLDGARGLFVPGIGWVNCCRVLNTESIDVNKCSMSTLGVFRAKPPRQF